MTTTQTHPTQEQWVATLRDRFGDSPANWAFACPSCGDVATGADFKAALAEHPRIRKDGTSVSASDILARECIGRTLGALARDGDYTGRGCDWAAYGLFQGPEFIILPDGSKAPCFPMAAAVNR